MDSAGIAGWHGKLPTLGDFATRRLDPAFVSAWDDWLSHGLAALQQGPAWPEAYLDSPSWRFLLMPGALPGVPPGQAWAGVLMPSVDRVGRYYPLTIAQRLPALPATAAEVEALWTWLVRIDETAADALHDDWAIDQLEAELQRQPLPPLGTAAAVPLPWQGALLQPLDLGGRPHAGLLLAAQAATAWHAQAQGLSFWSAHPEQQSARQFAARSLHDAPLLARLFGGSGDDNAG